VIPSNIIDEVEKLNDLSESTRKTDIEKSLENCDHAIEIAGLYKYISGLAKAFWNKGICYRLLSKYNKAFENFEYALKYYKEISDTVGESLVLNSIGNIYLNLSDYKNALECFNKCLTKVEQNQDLKLKSLVHSNIGLLYQEEGNYPLSLEHYHLCMLTFNEMELEIPPHLYNNIGIVYQNIEDYETALQYYFKSLKLTEKKKNDIERSFVLGNIAIVYGELKQYENSLNYFNESLSIVQSLGHKQAESNALINKGDLYRKSTQYEKALVEYNIAIQLCDEIEDYNGKAMSLTKIGETYSSKEELDIARKYFFESLKLSEKFDFEEQKTQNLVNLAKICIKEHFFENSLDYLSSALTMSKNRNANKEMYEIHKLMFEVYEELGDFYKALEHHKNLYVCEKEIFDTELDRKLMMFSIQNKMKNIENDKIIALREKEIFRLKNVQLAEANEKLKFLNEEKNEIMGIVVHDLKNPLSGILYLSKKLYKSRDDITLEEIKAKSSEIVNTTERMFELITKLLDINAIESGKRIFQKSEFNPAELIEIVVNDFKPKCDEKNIMVHFDNKCKTSITTDLISTRQIFENILSNAIKYSTPNKNIYISVSENENAARISVKDEGPGFTEKDKLKLFHKFARLSAKPTGGERSTGLGLSIVKKLVEAMDGEIYCISNEGKGSEFVISFPVTKESN
jgi:signal transduction histidine kinase